VQARWQRWWADALYPMGDLRACHRKVEELMCLVGEPIPVSMPGRYWFLLREFGRQLLHRAFPRITFGRGKAQSALLVEIVRALERYGQAGYLLNQPSEFLIGATNINHAEHAGATEFLASGYATLALLLANLGIGRAAEYYRQLALHFVQQDTNTAHRAHALEMIGFSFFVNSDFRNTERFMWQASILAEQAARRRFSLENQLLIAQSNGIQGNYHTQLRLGQLVFARARESGDVVVQTWALLTQIEVCLHIDRDPTVRVLPLLRQAQAQPSNKLNRAEHFGIHSNLAVVALRTGDSARAACDLGQAIAYVNSMALPANGAFESYANLSEVATALTALPDISPADQRIHDHRSDQAYAILHKFTRTHRFALPRKLIFEGIRNWQQGRLKKAFKNWQEAAALAPKFGARYDIARAHFEIGRHLAPQQTWKGQGAEYYLAQARSGFADIGAGYLLAQVERLDAPPVARGHDDDHRIHHT
jgi:tetratricopeptide (TPR) repeat protein